MGYEPPGHRCAVGTSAGRRGDENFFLSTIKKEKLGQQRQERV